MIRIPRSLELRAKDGLDGVVARLSEWTRDVREILRQTPVVTYRTVTIPSGGTATIETDGAPRSVILARVVSGTITATPGIAWAPSRDGVTVGAVYGVTGDARLTLRIEV